MRVEENNQLISILSDISELLGNGIFSIDSELEEELMEEGCINNYSDVYEGAINEVIRLIKMLNKIKENK